MQQSNRSRFSKIWHERKQRKRLEFDYFSVHSSIFLCLEVILFPLFDFVAIKRVITIFFVVLLPLTLVSATLYDGAVGEAYATFLVCCFSYSTDCFGRGVLADTAGPFHSSYVYET